MIPCQYISIDEASQVFDPDLFPLFNSIAFVFQTYEQRWPRISFIGDPYQLLPSTTAQLPPCYYYRKKLSFFWTFDSVMFTLFTLQSLNKIPTIKLNTQYRMVPEISAMINVLSHHNFPTCILPPDRINTTNLERIQRAPPIIYTGLLH